MKSKLLHGIIQDLLKMPSHGEPDHKGKMHVSIAVGEKPSEDPSEPDADDEEMMKSIMDPEHDKHKKMNSAIHAKHKMI